MSKFKVGDKVRRITFDNSCAQCAMEIGSLWKVTGVAGDWLSLDGYPFPLSSNELFFELVVEAAPTARSTDPATSKAKRRVNKYEEAVLRYLIAHGQGTGKEIATVEQEPLNCITPRFAPLRRRNLIKDTGVRKDKQIVWGLV